ncbi:MAG: CoA-binding domain protein, partial [Proteobacteria bacterium]|nr:CoA-binding domain protein [Pseudomonadota bacterium]
FGPVILFGSSSGAATIRDVAVALPPLNMLLARELVSRTRAARQLAGSAERPAADVEAICLALVQVSQLLADVDEVVELEIDPLLCDERGVLALDARIRVVPHRRRRGSRRFAIRPYPQELEQRTEWNGQTILLRPIRPEDELAHSAFLDSLLAEDSRYRFFGAMRHLPHKELARYTQIDYDREMAFVAIGQSEAGEATTLGEVRAVADPDNVSAEFAIVVRSELKGKGLGRLLLERLIAYLRDRGTRELRGETLLDNDRMQNLARDCGFKLKRDLVEGIVELRLPLQEALAG